MSTLLILVSLNFLIGWPWLLAPPELARLLSGAKFVLFVLVWIYTSSDLLSYWEGMQIVARASQRGCSGLGILLTLPILISVFIISILFLLIGVLRGREISQRHWARLISWFGFGITQSMRARP